MKKLVIFLFILCSFSILYYWRSRDVLLQLKYDYSHSNPYIDSEEEIDLILSQFKSIPYKEMDAAYLHTTNQNEDPFSFMLLKAVYYQVPQEQIYQKIVGDFRIKELLPKDDFYKQSLYGGNDSLYWLIDKKLLHQILAFQNELEASGNDRDAFIITNGYRHPHFNKLIGGASQSRHIVGEAVDITAKDVNRDGKINQLDKEIIVAIAEQIVGSSGGVGLYPGTLSIHIDTRGHRARWESF